MTTKYCRHIDPSTRVFPSGISKGLSVKLLSGFAPGSFGPTRVILLFRSFVRSKGRLDLAVSKLHIQAGQLSLSLGLWQ
jgi:hypothetical protein